MRAFLIAACACVAVLAPQGVHAQERSPVYDSGVRFIPAPEENTIVVTAPARPFAVDPEPEWMRHESALTRTVDGNQVIYTRRVGSFGPLELNLMTTATPLGIRDDIVPDRDANRVPKPQIVLRW